MTMASRVTSRGCALASPLPRAHSINGQDYWRRHRVANCGAEFALRTQTDNQTTQVTDSASGGSSAPIRVELLSQPRFLCGARELVAAVARRIGFGEHECGQIALAVDEALCNIIRHGYDRRDDGKIWVSVWPLGDQDRDSKEPEAVGIRIVIEDEARQVDPEAIKGRKLEDIRPGGLGVYIIRQVMDSTCYEKRECDGMRLVLTKYRGSLAERCEG